ncbi:hypothetical protein [Devosia sp.]|uniref:hypothetical protein n=1 Tax=Devosia sp. TaxID=1871048 RepID=UPI0019EA5EAD|nr:hypothetical protein [Devosia sp.]MBE0579002.1 hypothetical protein [Devosia sp.]
MAIGTDYPRPITVNGYVCRNCDDVANAKRNIDPAAPNGVEQAAVSFGGSLSGQQRAGAAPGTAPAHRLLDRTA